MFLRATVVQHAKPRARTAPALGWLGSAVAPGDKLKRTVARDSRLPGGCRAVPTPRPAPLAPCTAAPAAGEPNNTTRCSARQSSHHQCWQQCQRTRAPRVGCPPQLLGPVACQTPGPLPPPPESKGLPTFLPSWVWPEADEEAGKWSAGSRLDTSLFGHRAVKPSWAACWWEWHAALT